MVGDEDDDVEIAGRAALDAVLALAGQAQALAGGDAGRNLHLELALSRRAAVAAARHARLGDDAAGAAAVAAGAGDGEEALLVADLAEPAALRAGLGAGARSPQPEPLQVVQVSSRGMRICVSVPLAASSNAISRS